jgi:hypothetical protein
MVASILSDQCQQPAYQATDLPSVKIVIPENGSEITDSNDLSSVTTMGRADKELEQARCAIIRLAVDHPDRFDRSKDLASLISKRFEETGQYTLLSECIDIQRQICSLCTTENPNRASSLCDLALSLRTRFNQTGVESLLAEAITLNREALSLRPKGHPDRSISCDNLAIALCTYFNQKGDESLLSEGIDLFREALALRSHGHPDRSQSLNNLANSLMTHFQQTGEESLLCEGVDLFKEALSLRPSGHPDRSKSCNNLANALITRFQQTGEESLLTEAIVLYREALSLRPSGHPGRSYPCSNLAHAVWIRFNQTGEESLLTEAINLQREALYFQPRGHPERSMSCDNLANSLMTRFQQTGEESLVTEGIGLHRESLSLRPIGHPERFRTCTNLASSLCIHFKKGNKESLLIEAINLQREALSLHTSVHPARFEVCNGLATSLRTLFEVTGDELLLSEAINVIKDTMEAQPQYHPNRWHANLNLIHIYLNHRFSQRNTALAIDYMQQALLHVTHDWPSFLSEIAQLTSFIDLPTLSHDSISQLLQCFSAAIDLASRVAGFVLDPQSQLRYLSSSQHLGPRAYWCALTCGRVQFGLELIERARAVIWTQALHMRNPQLSGAPPELASELEVLLTRMHTLPIPEDPMSSSSLDQDVRHKNSERIHHLIQQIRALPGQERFMRGLSSKELAGCASRNAVVVLVATQGECHALILQAGKQEPVTLPLSDIVPDELTTMSIVASAAQRRGAFPDNMLDNYRKMKASPDLTRSDQTRSDPVLRKLWMTVVKPIIDHLQLQVRVSYVSLSIMPEKLIFGKKSSGSLRKRLHWCPTGPFMFLPLHAAGIYDTNNTECCADYVVCSYTPTLTALLRAQQSNPSFDTSSAKLGLVAAMNAWDDDLPTLWHVEDEINLVRAAAERASISIDDSNS